jgi:hypothetical protein
MTDDAPDTTAPADDAPDATAAPDRPPGTTAPDATALARAEEDAAAEAAIDARPSSADYSVAFSPRNVAVGLAIVAGVVAFAASRRHRRSSRGDG